MARRVRTTFREPAEKARADGSTSFMEADLLPDGAKKMIPYGDLMGHPDNFKLVPRLEDRKQILLRDDILAGGIREPLHVWPVNGKLLVVSGNERLLIVQSFTEAERVRSKTVILPCIVKKFNSEAEARQHIITVNENRKSVSLSPVDRLLALFPIDECPLLYADLRGYGPSAVLTEAKLPGGNFELGRELTIEDLRQEQKNWREKVGAVTGWKESFVIKVLHRATTQLKTDTSPVKIDRAREKELEKVRREMVRLEIGIKSAEASYEKAKKKLSDVKRQYNKNRKILEKYGLL